jgi:hypothetical protein
MLLIVQARLCEPRRAAQQAARNGANRCYFVQKAHAKTTK